MLKKNKNIFIGLGLIATTIPIFSVVACNVGQIFKSQIDSESRALIASHDVLDNVFVTGQIDHNRADKWLVFGDVFKTYDGKDLKIPIDHNNHPYYNLNDLKDAIPDWNQINFHSGMHRVLSFAQINSDQYKFATIPITKKNGEKKQIVLVYQITKQQGTSMIKLFNGNAFSGWVHNIVGMVVVDSNASLFDIEGKIEGLNPNESNAWDVFNFNGIWKWW